MPVEVADLPKADGSWPKADGSLCQEQAGEHHHQERKANVPHIRKSPNRVTPR
jgi:hypothetical protein